MSVEAVEFVGECELFFELAGEGVRSLLCLMESFWLSLRMRESLISRLKSWVERRGRTLLFVAGTSATGVSKSMPRRCSEGVAGGGAGGAAGR